MTITPDTKDWTWVIERPCPECGYDGQTIDRDVMGSLLRANGAEWQRALADSVAAGLRPRPDKWSPLEYCCHVRDAARIYAIRLNLMLTEDNPLYPNWDQDETAIEGRYGEQDPAVVSTEAVQAIEEIAVAFDAVEAEQWKRTGRRSDGAIFTVDTFARYFLHDLVHHAHDVSGG